MTSVTYLVNGMTCENCERTITAELKSLGGVSDVTVNLVPGGSSAVTVVSDVPVTRAAVAQALDEAGDYQLADEAVS